MFVLRLWDPQAPTHTPQHTPTLSSSITEPTESLHMMLPSNKQDLFPGPFTDQELLAHSTGGSIPTGYNQGWIAASDYGDEASGTWHLHHTQTMAEALPISMLGPQSNIPSFEASTHR
jgi:hypothetical protein